MKIGVMQGRLSPLIKNKIQAFPEKYWKSEFRKANILNIKMIEWTIDHKNFENNPLFDIKISNKLNYLKKKYKIKVPSITGDAFMQYPFWKKNYVKSLKNFDRLIFFCKKLKIRFIVLPLVDNGSLNSKKQLNNLRKILLERLEKIQKSKIKILFEIDKKPKEVLNFIELFPKKFFGINYDLGNSASKGYDIVEEFNLYGKYIDNIHIKDRKLGGTTVRLGKGNANFEEFYNQIIKLKYKGNLILQTARSKTNQHTKEIKINIDFLRKKRII